MEDPFKRMSQSFFFFPLSNTAERLRECHHTITSLLFFPPFSTTVCVHVAQSFLCLPITLWSLPICILLWSWLSFGASYFTSVRSWLSLGTTHNPRVPPLLSFRTSFGTREYGSWTGQWFALLKRTLAVWSSTFQNSVYQSHMTMTFSNMAVKRSADDFFCHLVLQMLWYTSDFEEGKRETYQKSSTL